MDHLTNNILHTIYKYCNPTTKQILRNISKFFRKYPIEKLSIKELFSICKNDVLIIQWMRLNGCQWNTNICKYLALNGHLDCLTYAHENGCPWNNWTCYFAATNGHLDCLKYAHENGCPWDEYTCIDAAR